MLESYSKLYIFHRLIQPIHIQPNVKGGTQVEPKTSSLHLFSHLILSLSLSLSLSRLTSIHGKEMVHNSGSIPLLLFPHRQFTNRGWAPPHKESASTNATHQSLYGK